MYIYLSYSYTRVCSIDIFYLFYYYLFIMSIIENLVSIQRKMANINLTNIEIMQVLKYEHLNAYIGSLHECHEKHSDNDEKFINCILGTTCPTDIKDFTECRNKNKANLQVCVPYVIKLEDCMKYHSNSFLSILEKAKNY